MSVPLYWWKLNGNFGDRLSPIVVRYLTGREIRYSEAPGKLLAVGSVMDRGAPGDVVWGAGLRRDESVRELHVLAVRGPLTRSVLLRRGVDCPAVYGDPAVFMPEIYRPACDKSERISVLPHYSDRILQWMAWQADLPVILPHEPPRIVIDRILKTELLVTSSLHGLILAEAYGVPVVLLRQRRQYWEPHFRFLDYFLSTGREDQTIWDVSIREAVRRVDGIEKPRPIDKAALRAAFPQRFFGNGGAGDPL